MTRRRTIRDIAAFKNREEAFACLTAYTAPLARIADRHADLLLVGDSLGMVIYGFDSTLPVTMDMMVLHGAAVVRSSAQALVVVDLPFGSYQESPEQAFRNAARLMAETGCGAVKLEGGAEMAPTIAFLAERGIPVMGHIGLQPQSVNGTGGYRVMGRSDGEQARIIEGGKALEKAGAFAVVLECVTPDIAARVTAALTIPTVGIGASSACDGQIIVTDDLLNLTPGPHPRFVKHYAALADVTNEALARFCADVRTRRFPGAANTYGVNGKSAAQGAE